MQGIEKEYEELDTVWFMGGSLFKTYPYDIPTEAFSFQIFKQAFAAIQVTEHARHCRWPAKLTCSVLVQFQ